MEEHRERFRQSVFQFLYKMAQVSNRQSKYAASKSASDSQIQIQNQDPSSLQYELQQKPPLIYSITDQADATNINSASLYNAASRIPLPSTAADRSRKSQRANQQFPVGAANNHFSRSHTTSQDQQQVIQRQKMRDILTSTDELENEGLKQLLPHSQKNSAQPKLVTHSLNSDRGGAINFAKGFYHQNQPSFGAQYFGDSFQVQQESLQNLANEEDLLLRDFYPQPAAVHSEAPESADSKAEEEKYLEANGFDSLNVSPINAQHPLSRIDNLNFEVQLNQIVSRIKGFTHQIKQRVRVQRQLSETFIQEEDEGVLELDAQGPMGFLLRDNGLDVSAIALNRPSYLADKSGLLADTSMILNSQAMDNQMFLSDEHEQEKDSSFLLISPPASAEEKGFARSRGVDQPRDLDISRIDSAPNPEQRKLEADKEQEEVIQQMPLELLEKVVVDLKTKHKAERDMLLTELQIFKKVINLMGAKIRFLQDEVLDKDKLERDLFKVTHLNMKLENQYKRLREENRKLGEKVEVMRKVMFEYDCQLLDDYQQDNQLIEQLTRENYQLQRLLLISESGGLLDYASIEEQLREMESLSVHLLAESQSESRLGESSASNSRRGSAIGYFNKRKDKRGGGGMQKSHFVPEPLNQSMPNEVKQVILERQMVKEEERRINIEMRRIAEEEIMRELKMAEEMHAQSEFQKTNSHLPKYTDLREGADDLDEEEEQQSTEKQTSGAFTMAQDAEEEKQRQVVTDQEAAATFNFEGKDLRQAKRQQPPPCSPQKEINADEVDQEGQQIEHLDETVRHLSDRSQMQDLLEEEGDEEEETNFNYYSSEGNQAEQREEAEVEEVQNVFSQGQDDDPPQSTTETSQFQFDFGAAETSFGKQGSTQDNEEAYSDSFAQKQASYALFNAEDADQLNARNENRVGNEQR